MKKLLFIYNLHAGKGALRGRLSPILDELTAEWDVTVHPTRGPGDATTVARDRAGEFDRIVCSGGDGTLHEVVSGLMELPKEARPTVGYIPAGTTNDFAKNLELPRTLEELAAVAAAGVPAAAPARPSWSWTAAMCTPALMRWPKGWPRWKSAGVRAARPAPRPGCRW